jgi:predicted ATPase
VIASIYIQGFKRFDRRLFDVAPLTILAGLNGSGKTSFIHALLLTWEATSGTSGSVVRLNGPFGLELGTAGDIRNWTSADSTEFVLHSASGEKSTWRFSMPAEDALYVTVDEKPSNPPTAFSSLARAFTYLCAERLGPRSTLGASPRPTAELEVGVHGEYCAQMLESLGDKLIEDKARVHPERQVRAAHLLKYEVEQWLADITRPIEVDAIRYSGSAIFALRFRTPGGEWVTPPNMGFGLSYALPVILAGLTAKAGGLLIVENPEAHLHPAGQSRMGTFLGWLASRGVQVFLETHSDHVLNGVRRAIGEYKYLAANEAIVHFFESGIDSELIVHPLRFTSIGGVSHWPRGFFDQYLTDVAILGRIRRGE